MAKNIRRKMKYAERALNRHFDDIVHYSFFLPSKEKSERGSRKKMNLAIRKMGKRFLAKMNDYLANFNPEEICLPD